MLTLFKFEQAENTLYPISVTLAGNVILVKPVLENAAGPMVVTLPLNFTLDKLIQFEKVFSEITVTPAGIVMLLNLWHPKNAPNLMEFNPLGSVIVSTFEQNAKACAPIVCNVDGREMFVTL